MTAVAEKPKSREIKFDAVQGPPDLYLMDPVYWYDHEPSGPPHPALVVGINMGTSLQLAVFRPESQRYVVKDGVKFCGDTTLVPNERESNGCWDYHPRVKAQVEARKQFEALLVRLGEKK
ncbi:MAG TPA: hypothetical protein VFG68_12845 [Fimbriiglobus sp.]|nr:hypothetical protein [Fimbriiglobus sp.]